MPAVIYTNQASLMAQKGLLGAQNSLANSVERLSSGLRINRAKDDAAGLGVGENLQKQLNGAQQGLHNVNDAISMAQTAEGALQAVTAVAQRIITLATQGANETMSADQRSAISAEIDKLRTSVQDMAKRTKYTDTLLFNYASNSTGMNIQVSNQSNDTISVGPNALGYMNISSNTAGPSLTVVAGVTAVTMAAASSSGATLNTDISNLVTAVGTAGSAAATTLFTSIQASANAYLNAIIKQRGELGAVQNQLEYTVANLSEFSNNLAASRSRVMDTDYAAETANLTKGQILQQASTAMLAQANQMPNVILSLLK
ncbi:MAG: flagellin [Betaproteobacteria bacterium]|jgi:flagellin|nr:flagellin [Betaproteobacteria bacterium]